MLKEYRKHEQERRAQGIPALALKAEQVADLIELIKDPPEGEEETLINLLTNQVPAGVDQAAYVKAAFLADIAQSNISTPLISSESATKLLGTMLGGYNIQPLIKLLNNDQVGDLAVEALSNTLLIFDAFYDIFELSKENTRAKKVINSWAEAEWFLNKPAIPDCISAKVLKVEGEINTDDLSPGPEAWSRPDIPLHALTMLKNTDFVDLSHFCIEQSIPYFHYDGHSSNEPESFMRDLRPDVIFCIGWSHLLNEKFLEIADQGVIGFHPAKLPSNRGRHPIIWALALGLEETASTFFKMEEGAEYNWDS